MVTGVGVACRLSAGFAGIASYFGEDQAAWAVGWVVGAQAIAWIAGNPLIGLLAESGSWRLGYLVPVSVAAVALVGGLLALTPSVWFTLALFCGVAILASLRSTTASTLGLDQLPAQPGAMMGARTASAQLGYMIGAAAGGAVLALADFGALGVVLFGGMVLSAVLIARVNDPQLGERGRYREPVPD